MAENFLKRLIRIVAVGRPAREAPYGAAQLFYQAESIDEGGLKKVIVVVENLCDCNASLNDANPAVGRCRCGAMICRSCAARCERCRMMLCPECLPAEYDGRLRCNRCYSALEDLIAALIGGPK